MCQKCNIHASTNIKSHVRVKVSIKLLEIFYRESIFPISNVEVLKSSKKLGEKFFFGIL